MSSFLPQFPLPASPLALFGLLLIAGVIGGELVRRVLRAPRIIGYVLIGMLLEDMLTDMGHTVVAIVPRVNEALAAAQREEFDLAILDVHLNGQAVFPVADALIERGIPFVFATGYGERGLPEQYRKRPILQKPFAKDDLEKILSALKI